MSRNPLGGSKATSGWPFSWALNRLLEAEPWARERLAPFAGSIIEVRGNPLPALRFLVLPGGSLDAGGEGEPSLTINLRPTTLLELARGHEHFLRAVEVQGEPRLASAIAVLMRHLRWDVEEDLSRLIGDAAAHRLAQAGRALAAWPREAARRLVATTADYAVEEKRVLVGRAELGRFAEALAELRDAVERLEKRIDRLG
ncbi:MAG TPA: SCP2 sterol-binding domain-containing protein [Burkholderiales bacterium]|nr:SCP2 sterol-binding domain-containing protein [Burkholderiales bacterium]